ncbi:MAG: hypothetical protein HYW15_00940 [Candidatus Giovannonibacteria bacterium]|nr:MAG: hypothetical protein HYW15_00940 [Candidatus Giovannonibacteria bacterium]
MDKEKVTTEDLAGMVARGFDGVHNKMDKGFAQVDKRFEQVDKRFEQVDKRFEQVDKRFEQVALELGHINARLSTVEHDVAQIGKDMISRTEFEDLMSRVKYLELKIGVESGK